MSSLVAHGGPPLGPGELAGAWHLDPFMLGLLLICAVVCARYKLRGEHDRALLVGGALVALAVALVSPLDAAARSLASAHMTQHVLLVAVAAPLLALAVLPTLRSALPLAGPATLAHGIALLVWHASSPYDAALRHDAVHVAEHGSFIVTAVLFWAVVAGAVATASVPLRLLLVFGILMETALLGVLMTFAPTPWYDGYAATTSAYGLDPLADQQLAGVIMWVPMAVVYVGAALALLVGWLREADGLSEPRPAARTPR